MAAATQTEEQVWLKLVVNEESNKVLFAEAGKDFVDALFSFLTLPLGTIARLVEKESKIGPVTVGCLNSLYQSVADLDKECMSSEACKEMLLQPRNSSEDYCNNLKLNIDDTEPTKYFACPSLDVCCGSYSSSGCPVLSTSTTISKNCACGTPLTGPVFLKHVRKGFVICVATFIITDDLIVMPNSVDYTSFGLLQNLGVNNTSSVKEMTVHLTKEKVLDLLKCALFSKSPLTDLFLRRKPSLERSRFFSCDVENNSDIQIKVKLIIRKSDGKVLFAQGEQDFADLILSFLAFPLGGVVRKLGGNCCLGSIDGLYKSIADLNGNKYLMSRGSKNRLVDPHLAPQFKLKKQLSKKQLLPIREPSDWQYYCYFESNTCNDKRNIHVQYFNAGESRSAGIMNLRKMHLLDPCSTTESPAGFVKGPAMYMATDDLVVTPLSPISSLHLLNRLKTPLNDIKERVVTIGIKECLNILKASLTSTSALTTGLGHLLTEVKAEK